MQLITLLNKKMDKIIFKLKEITLKETVIFHPLDIFKIKKQLITLLYRVREIIQMDLLQQIVHQLDLLIINKTSHQLYKIILLMEIKDLISINRLLP